MISSYTNRVNDDFKQYTTIHNKEEVFENVNKLKDLVFECTSDSSKRDKYYEDYDYPLITEVK